jgi:CheY-like chemotaxis protein
MPGYPWLSVFRRAQEERDPSKIQACLSEAERAIVVRMAELRGSNDDDAATQAELNELRSCLDTVRRLEAERRGGPSQGVARAPGYSEDRNSAPIRIVLADDSEVLRRALIDFFKLDKGIALVGVAADAQEAFSTLEKVQADVLLFDLNMAVRDARYDEFKALSEQVALVAISVHVSEVAEHLAKRCGATCVVDKMEMNEKLLPAIVRSASARSRPSS